MKRLKAMTNREWVQRHEPVRISELFIGGVNGCPFFRCASLENHKCYGNLFNDEECTACWNLPAKRNGKYIMKVVKE